MKHKQLIIGCLLTSIIAISGCGSEVNSGTDNSTIWETVDNTNEISGTSSDNSSSSANDVGSNNSDDNSNSNTEDVFEHDYHNEIIEDVNNVVTASATIKEELKNIQTVTDKYEALFNTATTQFEMNQAAGWYYQIWDAELNNLWSRFSNLADEDTKQRVLSTQRNWNNMKEDVIIAELGPREEGGSIYPMERFSELEEMTKTRSYIIANELAKITGETFTMPEGSSKYGTFVDDQGTGDIYSTLITRPGWEEGTNEAIISIYREGEVEGTFVENSDGTLSFTSNDGNVEGIITINGWEGASFKVTSVTDASFLSTDETHQFSFVF